MPMSDRSSRARVTGSWDETEKGSMKAALKEDGFYA